MQNQCLTISDFTLERYDKYGNVYVHPEIADLDRPIFRYIQLDHLIAMLKYSELYVPNRRSFNDKTEQGYRINNKNVFPLSYVSKNKKETKKCAKIAEEKWQFALNVCISCWTYDSYVNINDKKEHNVVENYLMWKSYGDNGICCRIETTINELIRAIKDENNAIEDILVSEVKYAKEHPNCGNPQHNIFEKPVYYENENELRLCVLNNSKCVKLKIDPFVLIKKIVISPFISKELSDFIIEALKQKYPNWNVIIEKSPIME